MLKLLMVQMKNIFFSNRNPEMFESGFQIGRTFGLAAFKVLVKNFPFSIFKSTVGLVWLDICPVFVVAGFPRKNEGSLSFFFVLFSSLVCFSYMQNRWLAHCKTPNNGNQMKTEHVHYVPVFEHTHALKFYYLILNNNNNNIKTAHFRLKINENRQWTSARLVFWWRWKNSIITLASSTALVWFKIY